MRSISTVFAGLFVAVLALPVPAGITVTAYQTIGQVNGYAPVSQAQFFEQQTLTNVSPALAQVSGDWMGPNAVGSTITWHYVGAAHSTSTTVFDANNLTVTAAGSFAYTVDTTSEFIDPGGIAVYRPGAAANYNGFFNTDVSATYSITARLNQWSQVRLNTLLGDVVFNHVNTTPNPILVELTGIILPGEYRLLLTTGLGAGNLPNGVNHFEAGGSFQNASFVVQVPEPRSLALIIAMVLVQTHWGNQRTH